MLKQIRRQIKNRNFQWKVVLVETLWLELSAAILRNDQSELLDAGTSVWFWALQVCLKVVNVFGQMLLVSVRRISGNYQHSESSSATIPHSHRMQEASKRCVRPSVCFKMFHRYHDFVFFFIFAQKIGTFALLATHFLCTFVESAPVTNWQLWQKLKSIFMSPFQCISFRNSWNVLWNFLRNTQTSWFQFSWICVGNALERILSVEFCKF